VTIQKTQEAMMSSWWKDPFLTMFPSLWSTSRSVSTKVVSTKQLISPTTTTTQDSINQQQKHNRQQQQQHRDIEAAADHLPLLTPVVVQPVSSNLPLPLENGNNNGNSRSYQQDGDPFYRRTSVTTNQNNNNENSLDVSISSATSTVPLQQQPSLLGSTTYSDAIQLTNNIRSGNFATTSDALLMESNMNNNNILPSVTRATATASRGGGSKIVVTDPKLLHPYVYIVLYSVRLCIEKTFESLTMWLLFCHSSMFSDIY
jgi:hypothetical protein